MPEQSKKMKIASNDFLTEDEIKHYATAVETATALYKRGYLLLREFKAVARRINKEKFDLVHRREREEYE